MRELINIPKSAMIDARLYFADIASFIYQVIIASEPLLEVAITKMDGDKKKYLEQHLKEEHDHAAWLKEDLKELGIDVDVLPYNVTAAEMVGSQYYILNHCNPVGFFGYMLYLEAFTANMELINQLESIYGEKAVRTIKYHAVHDVEHSADLEKIIDTFSEEEKAFVLENAQNTANNYAKAMVEIAEKNIFGRRFIGNYYE